MACSVCSALISSHVAMRCPLDVRSDPDTALWCVLLTNRVHPSRNAEYTFTANVGPIGGEKRGILAVRALIGDIAAAGMLPPRL